MESDSPVDDGEADEADEELGKDVIVVVAAGSEVVSELVLVGRSVGNVEGYPSVSCRAELVGDVRDHLRRQVAGSGARCPDHSAACCGYMRWPVCFAGRFQHR